MAMRRRKVKLVYIHNDSARKATLKKRTRGLLKKVHELSTLCGIDACAIIFSPYDSQPHIWPQDPAGVEQVLSNFKKMDEIGQTRKAVDQGSFLQQRIDKALEKLRKQRKDNREKETTRLMFLALNRGALVKNFNIIELNDLGRVIDKTLNQIYKKIEGLNKPDTSAVGTTCNNTLVVGHPSASCSSSSSSQAAAAMVTSGGGDVMVQQFMDNDGSSLGFDHLMNYNTLDEILRLQQRLQLFQESMNQPQEDMGFVGEETSPIWDAIYSHSNPWTHQFNYP